LCASEVLHDLCVVIGIWELAMPLSPPWCLQPSLVYRVQQRNQRARIVAPRGLPDLVGSFLPGAGSGAGLARMGLSCAVFLLERVGQHLRRTSARCVRVFTGGKCVWEGFASESSVAWLPFMMMLDLGTPVPPMSQQYCVLGG